MASQLDRIEALLERLLEEIQKAGGRPTPQPSEHKSQPSGWQWQGLSGPQIPGASPPEKPIELIGMPLPGVGLWGPVSAPRIAVPAAQPAQSERRE